MVITGAAPAVPERVSHRVYLDAALPDPGRSLLDLFLSAGCDLTTVPGRKQAKSYVERIGFDPKRSSGIPRACISCTKSDYPLLTLIVRKKIAAAPEKWTCLELPLSHAPMADLPGRLGEILVQIAERVS